MILRDAENTPSVSGLGDWSRNQIWQEGPRKAGVKGSSTDSQESDPFRGKPFVGGRERKEALCLALPKLLGKYLEA